MLHLQIPGIKGLPLLQLTSNTRCHPREPTRTNESLPNAQIHAIHFQEKGNAEDKRKMVEASSSGCSTLLTAQRFLHFTSGCILQKHFCITRQMTTASTSVSCFTSSTLWFPFVFKLSLPPLSPILNDSICLIHNHYKEGPVELQLSFLAPKS